MPNKPIIHKLVYTHKYRFYINDNVFMDENELNEKFWHWNDKCKNEYILFTRKLKLLNLLGKSDKELWNTLIYDFTPAPMNFDFASLYPSSMKKINPINYNKTNTTFDTINKKIIEQRYGEDI